MVSAGQVADNTIILPAGTYANTQGALDVTHDLILQGAGAAGTIIDGGGKDRVFFINPGTAVNVQLSGVTIQNGNTTGFGGGIDVEDVLGQSSALSLTNCVVTGNTAALSGGGFFQQLGTLIVTDSQFTGNVCSTLGGGLYFSGSYYSISGSTFNNNGAACRLLPSPLGGEGEGFSLTGG
jgi:hypothetical protein